MTYLGEPYTQEVTGMDAAAIMRIKPTLTEYLHEFDGCMGRVTNRGHLATYVSGQLSDLDRKSIEPMADAAGVPPRTLQEFLGLLKWDESAARDRLQQRVARRHGHPHSVGIIDETSFVKKGEQTACVQRQHCGAAGKQENCVVSVHLGYAAGDFHTLLDGELYLPEEKWHEDRARCRRAGIPDEVVYRPKWEIAVGQVQRALGNGVRFAWLTFDEGYGGKPPFLRAIDALGQHYVGEIPVSFVGWTVEPQMLHREHARDRRLCRPRKLPRFKVRNTPFAEVREILKHSPILRKALWQKYRVKDGEKGPMVWEAKCIPFWIKDENGLPSRPHRLIVARNVLNPEEVKFFLSNAPESVPLETLLLVAFSRWRIERLFEDSKTELGLDHFEVRHYRPISRHLILTCVSHLFLAEFRENHRGKKSRPDRRPTTDRHARARAAVVARGALFPKSRQSPCRAIDFNAAAKCPSRRRTPQTNDPAFAGDWNQADRRTHVQVVEEIAL
jgi:SRSO17 transposase